MFALLHDMVVLCYAWLENAVMSHKTSWLSTRCHVEPLQHHTMPVLCAQLRMFLNTFK